MAQQNDDPPNAGLQENCKKLAQLRVEKLRKEDEEEQWISGEELYTEGSSDEDLADPRARRRVAEDDGGKMPPRRKGRKCASPRNHKRRLGPIGASGGASSKDSLVPDVRVSSQLSDSEAPLDRSVESEEEEEEEEVVEISWRPKRGSIKLPELSTEGGRLRRLVMKDALLPNYLESSLAAALTTRQAMDKIKEMDALLFMVEAKRKESLAKTEQSQMKIREILKELCEETSKSGRGKFLARSASKFIKLCSSHASDADHREPCKRPSFAVQMKGTTRRRRRKGRRGSTTRKRNNASLKFLHRNVQLAADGKGTLAVTTEERERLATLLRQGGRKQHHPTHSPAPPAAGGEKFLRLDPSAAQLLTEIDSKLKEYAVTKEGDSHKGEELPVSCALNLEQIELGLSRLNEATTEALCPLGEGELRILLEACQRPPVLRPRPPPSTTNSSHTSSSSSCSSGASVWANAGTERDTPTEQQEVEAQPLPPPVEEEAPPPTPPDTFGELVAEARRLMPFFKFRY